MRSLRKDATSSWVSLFALAVVLGCLMPAAAAAQDQAADAYARAVEVYAARRDADDARQAIALYQEAVAQDPGHLPALLGLAEAHWWLAEQIPKAERRAVVEAGLVHARRAVELAPDEPAAHFWYGVLQARVGEERGILQSLFMVDDVLAAMERTLELDPEHEGAHYVLSQLYRKVPGWPLSVGDKRKAVEHARISASLAPHDTSRQLNLAESLLEAGQKDEAVQVLRRVVEMPLTPGDEVNSRRDQERARELLQSLGG